MTYPDYTAEQQALLARERARMAEPGYRDRLIDPPADLLPRHASDPTQPNTPEWMTVDRLRELATRAGEDSERYMGWMRDTDRFTYMQRCDSLMMAEMAQRLPDAYTAMADLMEGGHG